MNAKESKIRRILFEAIKDLRTPEVTVSCEAEDNFMMLNAKCTETETGVVYKNFLGNLRNDRNSDIMQCFEELREASRKQPNGPWFRCEVTISDGHIEFSYLWDRPADPLESDPSKAFWKTDRLTLDVVSAVQPADVFIVISNNVPIAIRQRQKLPAALLEFFALVDWECDTRNGSFNQYYARDVDWFGTGTRRSELYPLVVQALSRLELVSARQLFEESIALYSHFYPRVDQSRRQMCIPAIPKQTESDITSRYYGMSEEIQNARDQYFVANPHEFAVG